MAPLTPVSIENQFHRYYQKLTPVFKKPKTKATTTAVFSFLAMALFVLYAIRPTAQTIIYLRREIADKTVLNQQMENKITALIEAQATFETIKDRLGIVDQALPKNPDALVVARQLNNLVHLSGASVSAMQIPSLPLISNEATPGAKIAAAAAKPLEEFPVSIVINGSYASLESFMEGLLQMRRIVRIDSLSFKQTQKRGVPGSTLQLSIRLKSYYSKQ